jgi:flagellar motility protein MotE (MotC chaperone)/sporulation protein YlmC with PRC-barrel domain
MSKQENQRTSVSALLGVAVADVGGQILGYVSEFAVRPLVDASHVEALVVRGSLLGRRQPASLIRTGAMRRTEQGMLQLLEGESAAEMTDGDTFLMLERDLLDQQIIDVHGHKVVRVNDVDLVWEMIGEDCTELALRIAEVEVGLRGAARRLLKGLPNSSVHSLTRRLKPRVIPWDFVDLIDRDPARRVRLKIEQDRLSQMHPSDLADILEELAPAEGQALFTSLDEEVAADTLEEVELKTQKALIESLDSETVAGIIEEMDPGAAADLLSELPEERSDAILGEMGEKERQEVEELLDYAPDSAAGLMTTDYVAVRQDAGIAEALEALRIFEGDLETVTEILLLDEESHLTGQVGVSRLLLAAHPSAEPAKSLAELAEDHVVTSELNANGRKVAELFDKYNLRCLPVLDQEKLLAGVIRAEHVIAWLRTRH